MLFEDFTYRRPDMTFIAQKIQKHLDDFEKAPDFERQEVAFMEINKLRTEFMSMYNICHIRHTIDTNDKFYEEAVISEWVKLIE